MTTASSAVEWKEPPASKKGEEDRVTVATLNVLSQTRALDTHALTPLHLLKWPHRRERLLSEIGRRDATLLCLQDVDDEAWWHRVLSQRCGYDVLSQKRQRTDEAPPRDAAA